MSPGWSSDFSYKYFRKILQAIKSNFKLHLISEARKILNRNGQPKLFLRHDVDVSLKRAFKMAEIEKEFEIHATYMVIANSPLYCLKDEASKDILQRLIDMGHEIGLHFDYSNCKHNNILDISILETEIDTTCKHLENITGVPILSISFHRPVQQFLRGSLSVCNRINAYSKELMAKYISDSKGCWREGKPLPMLLKNDEPLIQLLIHPIWWECEHKLPGERLQEFFEIETYGQSAQYVKAFSDSLSNTIPAVQRSGIKKTMLKEDKNEEWKI